MSSAKDRHTELVEMISNRSEPISVANIARVLSVTERTVRRDLNELRRAGIELVSVSGRRGGIVLGANSGALEIAAGPRDSHYHPSDSPDSIAPASTLIGRERELDEFQRLLDAVAEGRGGTVTVLGEPGMGKTVLLDALINLAEGRVFDIAWCYNLEQGTRTGVELWKQLVDGLRTSPQEESVAPTDSSQAYVQLERGLKGRSGFKPAVVVIDDLQWADEHSLDLIRIASHMLPDSNVVLAIGCREPVVLYSEPVRQTIDTLARGRRHTSIALEGLSPADAKHLLASSSGHVSTTVTLDEAEMMVDRTGGNPMFIKELAERDSRSTVSLPRRVTDAVFERYEILSADTRTVLLHAAFLGRAFTLSELAAVLATHLSVDASEALHEAARARFVRFDTTNGTYEFLHDLLPESIAEPMSTNLKQQMHLSTAEGLENLYGTDNRRHCPRISEHYRKAGLGPEDQRPIDRTVAAGLYCLASMEWLSARTCFEWVIANTDSADLRRAEALVGLMKTFQQSASRAERIGTSSLMTEAYNIYVGAEMLPDAAETAAFPLQAQLGRGNPEQQVIEDALELTVPESDVEARLLARLGICRAHKGLHISAQDFGERAIEIATRLGDPITLSRVWCDRAIALNASGRHLDRYHAAKAAYQSLADSAQDPNLRHQVLYHLANAAQTSGRPEEAISICNEMISDAEARGSPGHLASGLGKIADVWIDLGDMRRSRSAIARTLEIDPDDSRVHWIQILTAAVRGDEEATRKAAEDNLRLCTRDSSATSLDRGNFMGAAAVAMWLSQLKGWRSELAAQVNLTVGAIDGLSAQNWFVLRGLGLCAVVLEDEVLAREVMIANLEATWRDGQLALFPWVTGIIARYLGDYDTAINVLLEYEERRTGKAGIYWLFSVIELIGAFIDRAEPGDHESAQSLITLASVEAERLAAVPIIMRLEEYKSRLKAAEAQLLTSRELEVLSYVATGLSNQQIADKMFLSRHTINRHMSNILQKIGATGRTDAVTRAMQQGLLSSE